MRAGLHRPGGPGRRDQRASVAPSPNLRTPLAVPDRVRVRLDLYRRTPCAGPAATQEPPRGLPAPRSTAAPRQRPTSPHAPEHPLRLASNRIVERTMETTVRRFDRRASTYETSALQPFLFGPVQHTALQLAASTCPRRGGSSPTSFQGIRTQSGCSHAAPTPRPDPNRPWQDAGPSPPGRCRLQSHPLVPITGRPGHRRPEDDHDPPPKVSLKRSSLDARAAMTVRVTGSSMACKRPGSRLCCSNLATSLRRPVGHCRRRGTDPSSHEIPPSPGPARELAGQAGPDEPRRRAG
jgi:hypothetical protein